MTRILFLVTVLFIIVSCNRSQDEEMPAITFIQPSSSLVASTYDTLHIEVKVTDNEQLSECVIRVVNAALVPVFPSVVQTLSGREQTISINYLLDDPRVASGSFYIEVQASDGNNLSRKFSPLQFSQDPREFKGLCFVTQPHSLQTQVYRCDTTWQPQMLVQYNHDFADMAVSSWWQQLYVCGSNNGTLHAEPLSLTASPWQVNIPQGPPAAWKALCEFDRRIWAAQFGGEKVRAFENTGLSAYNVSSNLGMRPYQIARTGRYVITAEQDAPQAVRQLAVYDALAGGALQQYQLALDVVAIVPRDSVSVFVYGNAGGQGYIYLYDCFANTIWQPYTLPAGTVLLSACTIDSNTQLLSFTNGTVSRFTMNPIGVVPWHTGTAAQHVRFEPQNNYVITAEAGNILIYDYAGAQVVHTLAAPGNVSDLELWYNW